MPSNAGATVVVGSRDPRKAQVAVAKIKTLKLASWISPVQVLSVALSANF